MKKKLFKELLESVKEAGAINKRGINITVSFLLKPTTVGIRIDKYRQIPANEMLDFTKRIVLYGFIGSRVWYWPLGVVIHLVRMALIPKDYIVPEAVEVSLRW